MNDTDYLRLNITPELRITEDISPHGRPLLSIFVGTAPRDSMTDITVDQAETFGLALLNWARDRRREDAEAQR